MADSQNPAAALEPARARAIAKYVHMSPTKVRRTRVLGERGPAILDEKVEQVMTRKVITCRPSDTVAAIMETMTEGKFRHLPVVDQGKLVGVISIGDVVKWRVGEIENESAALREYIATA